MARYPPLQVDIHLCQWIYNKHNFNFACFVFGELLLWFEKEKNKKESGSGLIIFLPRTNIPSYIYMCALFLYSQFCLYSSWNSFSSFFLRESFFQLLRFWWICHTLSISLLLSQLCTFLPKVHIGVKSLSSKKR